MLLWTYRLAVAGAVDGGGSEEVEAACRIQAATALPAVTQAVVSVLHQSLTRSQDAALAEHAHRLAHCAWAERRSEVTQRPRPVSFNRQYSPHLYLLQAHWFCGSDRKARSSWAASPCQIQTGYEEMGHVKRDVVKPEAEAAHNRTLAS